MVELFVTNACPRGQRQVLHAYIGASYHEFCETARQKIAPTDRHSWKSRATLFQILPSAARILQYPITWDVEGEVGTQLPHRPG
jgi:hypothetical protein